MGTDTAQVELIANALCEIRLLLSSYLGSKNDAPLDVRVAAHLAYALHNEASTLSVGGSFDVTTALARKRSGIERDGHQ